MFEIQIQDKFDSAHNLRGYNGPCENLHGHCYKVVAIFRFEQLDELGMAMDFTIAKKHLKEIVDFLDHTYLNELEPFLVKNPTAENIAYYIHRQLKSNINELYSISIWETTNSCATYYE